MREIFADAVDLVSEIMDDVKSTVSHLAYASDPGNGAPAFAAAVSRRVFVNRKRRRIVTEAGSVYQIEATLTFAESIAIHPRDVFTLADGTTAPVVDTGGFMDPATDRPFVTSVMLGNLVR